MIRYLWMFNLTDRRAFDRSEQWYERVHAPQVLERRRPWLGSYRSWYALPTPAATAYNYRLTEMTFKDLRAQQGAGNYTQYPGQAADWGIGDAFYSRTDAFEAPGNRPPTAVLVEGATDALPIGVRETTAIASANPSLDARTIIAAAHRPGVLALRVTPSLKADDDQLRDAFLFPSPWQFLVEAVFADLLSAQRAEPATQWASTVDAMHVATCLTPTEPARDYLIEGP